MEPIRILHVLGKLNRGGAETLVMNWYRTIDKSLIQFDFVVHTTDKCSYTDEVLSMGGRIYTVPSYCGINHLEYVNAWKKFFAQHTEYKIIHGHVRSTALIYLSTAKRNGLITISHSHSINAGTGLSGFVKRLMQYPIRYIADYKWACSVEAGRFLFGKKQLKDISFKVINNAIDVHSFSYDENVRKKMRDKLQIGEEFVVGHIGRFIPEKNHEFILDIFEKYHKEKDNSVLILVGVGPLMSDIQSSVQKRGLEDAVRFLGERSDVSEIMQALDVFLFPSTYEGLGIVAIEAQASGLPILISEMVPKEVKITDTAFVLPIHNSNSANLWTEKLFELSNEGYTRKKTDSFIIKAGYDISEATNSLVNDYLALLQVRR